MPRAARQKSASGIYHIMVRGINRQEIFIQDEDYARYLSTLVRMLRIGECTLYGYCLMRNHVHLLIGEGRENIGQVMKRIGSSYVRWYNDRYERVGHLFQDRFRSNPVEGDDYFLGVLRYIHQNPVKAGLTASCAEYRWSSYHAYLAGDDSSRGFVQPGLATGLLGGTDRFLSFTNDVRAPILDDLEDDAPVTDEDIAQVLSSLLRGQEVASLRTMDKVDRDWILQKLKQVRGSNLVQISRVTGLSFSMVQRA